ncbi:putative FBD-associated F-box protein At5g38570 [Cryptomeria japonica]|uniref:putative FBD-associated F-box protein At5g38570 n=1 Tax=Cryptomeria japonica TaxID=3369 RepID=UPI0027D9F69A|nr:putative FBD-associated F-box protein At5g38570 [Cryptomeria japonica]
MSTHDAFYELPDSLVAFILSKTPLKDAVKSSILSKRWRFLYTQMPQLTFTPRDIFGPACFSRYPLLRPSVEQIISNILVLHSGNLEAFHLHGTMSDFIHRREFSHDSVCKWVSVKSLSVNCPKLKILSGYMIENLSVNGVRFYELSFAISNVEMHCGGTLRKLTMCFSQEQRNNPGVISASRFLHIMGNFQSLKTLVILTSNPFEREPDMDVYLFNLLHKLPNLQELSISDLFVQELARDPIPVCLTPPHLHLKKVRVGICGFDLDNKEVAVISCLLQSMPSLELLEIQLPDVYDDDDGQIFIDDSQRLKLLKDILYMRRASLLATIVVLD